MSQVSRLIHKDKFFIVNTSYECGFSNSCSDLLYCNKLNSVVPKFVVLEVNMLLIIALYYSFVDKIFVNILLVILFTLSICFGK